MSEKGYNGWTNWETWNFNLHYDDYFRYDAEECYTEAFEEEKNREDAISEAIDYLDKRVETVIDEMYEEIVNDFVKDIVHHGLGVIDTREIAEHYINDLDYDELEASYDFGKR